MERPSPTDNHALVFGASGVSGWATVNTILNDYPKRDSFRRVTALTNRPLPPDIAQWPPSEKLRVVSGLDLLRANSQGELEAEMKDRVPDVENVSIVYFFAYVMDTEPEREIQINIKLLKRAVTAVENLSKKMRFVVFPTGTKVMGTVTSFCPWPPGLTISDAGIWGPSDRRVPLERQPASQGVAPAHS